MNVFVEHGKLVWFIGIALVYARYMKLSKRIRINM